MADVIADKIRNPDGSISGSNTGNAASTELVRGNDSRLADPRIPLSHQHGTATPITPGFLATADKAKLNTIEPSATKNAPDADLRDRTTHTGVQPVSSVDGLQALLDSKMASNASLIGFNALSGPGVPQRDSGGSWVMLTGSFAAANHTHALATTSDSGFMPSSSVVKLNTIAANATQNAPDAQLRDRSTHTGTQALSTIAGIGNVASKNAGSGPGEVPFCDSLGKLPTSVIPAISTGRNWLGVAADQSGMLALRGGPGDWCTRSDLSRDYVIIQNNGSSLTDWRGLSSAGSDVTSVNGQTGSVLLTSSNIIEGTNLYFTIARVQAVGLDSMSGSLSQAKVTDLVGSLAGKQPINSNLTAIAGLTGVGAIERTAYGSYQLQSYSLSSHTHANATTSAAGFMSASDKTIVAGLGTASTANTGTSSGNVPVLDGSGKLSAAVLPAQSVSNVFTAANQTAMLALSTAIKGDYAVRTDLSQTFILSATPASTLGNWVQLTTSAAVTSVNGISGAVSLTTTNIAEGTNLYFTNARVQAVAMSSLTGDIPQSRVTNLVSDLANHTHSAATTSVAGFMSTADKTKLDGIAVAATANATNSQLRDRSTHTGTQANTTITGLGTSSTRDVGVAAGNVPVLDSNGKIDVGILPSLAITNTFVVANQAAMLSLTADVGDVAIRTDVSKSFILQTAGASTLANWQEMLTPAGAVASVNGATGTVVLTTTNITEGTNLYFTTARVQAVSMASMTGDIPESRVTNLVSDLAGKQASNSNLTALSTFTAGTAGFVQRLSGNTFQLVSGTLLNTTDRSNLDSLATAGGTSAAYVQVGTTVGKIPVLQTGGFWDIATIPILTNSQLPVVSIAKGGTGQTTATAALNALAPNQSGNAGKVLTSDGTNIILGTGNRHVDIQSFGSSGTWTKPVYAIRYTAYIISGGGGGGSGQQAGAGLVAIGGNGGNAGGMVVVDGLASQLSATESVTVGTGGAGAASRSTDGDGLAGSAGGSSAFAGFTVPGGDGGKGGNYTGTVGSQNGPNPAQSLNHGSVRSNLISSQLGGQAGAAPTPVSPTTFRSTGGGAGGGYDAANAIYANGTGGTLTVLGKTVLGGANTGGNGLNGVASDLVGTGGGGSSASGSAASAGTGALYGGGGGGAAGRRTGDGAKPGGVGGAGYVIVITECHVS